MGASGALARLDVRRRWRSLVVIVLLTGASGAVVLAAAAGAHRGATAADRLEAVTLPADAFVLPNQPGFDWQPVRDLPYVTALAELAIVDTIAVEGDYDPGVVAYPPVGPDDLFTVEKPVVLEGRMLDPHDIHEVVVTSDFLERYDNRVGDRLTLALGSPQQVNYDALPADQLDGPRVPVEIVGVVRSPWNYDLPGRKGLLIPSPALADTYPDSILGPPGRRGLASVVNAQVRLEHGAADIPQLRKDLERLTGRGDIDVWDIQDRDRIGRHRIEFESVCLVGFTVVALLVALFVVGQALWRHVAYAGRDVPTAAGLGATPTQLVVGATAPALSAVLVGLGVAVALAIGASRWFPIGAAAAVEPDPGTDVDALVLGAGAALLLLAFAAMTLLASVATIRAARRSHPARRSPLAALVAGLGLPVSLAIGTRFALERGRGANAVPVRPALAGAVIGIIGTVGVLVFDGSITDALHHPERVGQTEEAAAFTGFGDFDYDPKKRVRTAVEALPYVTQILDTQSAVATDAGGATSVQLFSNDGELDTVVLDGRMPASATEVALGPDSLAALGVTVGDRVTLVGDRGTLDYEVVGSVLTPEIGGTNNYSDGGWVTSAGWHRLFEHFVFKVLLMATDGSVAPGAAAGRISDDLETVLPAYFRHGFTVDRPDLADVHSSLSAVRAMPKALGVFTVLLSIAALAHALAVAVRRRSGEIAVLRALGLTPAQTRVAVFTQATVMMLVGLAAGIPLGIAAGRTLWRRVADYTPLDYAPPTQALAILLVVPAALVVVGVLGILPGRRAARTRAAALLRAE